MGTFGATQLAPRQQLTLTLQLNATQGQWDYPPLIKQLAVWPTRLLQLETNRNWHLLCYPGLSKRTTQLATSSTTTVLSLSCTHVEEFHNSPT
jgi:hypothetical protein